MSALPERVDGPRLVGLRAASPCEVTSFAPVRGGRVRAHAVLVLEVRNEELGPEVDVDAYAAARLADVDPTAVAMLTGRDVTTACLEDRTVDGVRARALVTAGLSNAVRIGAEPGVLHGPSTIDVIVAVDQALTEVAALELMGRVAEAKATAVLEAGILCRRTGGRATGTGTDCVAVVSPVDGPRARYAGTHTPLGAAVGAASLAAIERAVAAWKERFGT